MSTSAKIIMLLSQSVILLLTVYFFIKVLKSPKRSEPDSYSENDDDLNQI